MAAKKKSSAAGGMTRRECLVLIGGSVLGAFTMPAIDAMAEVAPAAKGERLQRNILSKPTKSAVGGNSKSPFHLVWTEQFADGKIDVMYWAPQGAEEVAEAQRFYDEARNFNPHAEEGLAGMFGRATDKLVHFFTSSKRSDEEAALLAAIHADLEADEPRLKYAEWLSARKDPRGEFIRLDCLMESDPNLDEESYERWSDLLDKYAKKWNGPLVKMGVGPSGKDASTVEYWFNRGFVEEVEIDKPNIIPAKADALFDAAPVLHTVEFNYDDLDVPAIVNCPRMAQIRKLNLGGVPLDGPALESLAASPHLDNLRDLKIEGAEIRGATGAMLANSAVFRRLTDLWLSQCTFDRIATEAYFESPAVERLQSLQLPFCKLEEDSSTIVAGSSRLRQLRELRFEYGNDGDRTLTAIANNEALRNLEVVCVSLCYDTSTAGLRALAESKTLQSLRALEYGGEGDDETVAQLVGAPLVAGLTTLSLAQCGIGEAACRAIASSPHLGKLRTLSLIHCPIGPAGVSAITRATTLQLDTVDLRYTKIGLEGCQALAASAAVKQWKKLTLDYRDATPEGVALLREHFPEDAMTVFGGP